MKLIAETAWHHDGDFIFFKKLVTEIVTKLKPDFIKFHISLDIAEYMHHDHQAYTWLKERMFSISQWTEIFEIVADNGKQLMLLFNDKKAIDFGIKYQPELVEIHSVCLNDINLLYHLKDSINKDTKVVLGVGGSELNEIENAISIINSKNIILMHGFQNYPTRYKDINFGKMKNIMHLYPEYEYGYADHTAWNSKYNIDITLFGAALGMEYIEKHVTTAYGEERVDWQAAISIEMFNNLSEKLTILSKAYGDGLMKLNTAEKSYSTFGANKKAAILTKSVKKGDKLSKDNFCFKRTGQSSDLSQLKIIDRIGSVFSKNLKRGHCIIEADIE